MRVRVSEKMLLEPLFHLQTYSDHLGLLWTLSF